MNNRVAIALVCAGSALVAGCGRKAPQGQVAATVNGKEITLQELNTELQASNIPASADKQTVQRALLQRIVERKLLVDGAEKAGIDKTPDYLAQKRRTDELLLVQSYARQQLSRVPVPSAAQVDKFMADNPQAFAQRQQLVLDQIRFPTPPSPQALTSLKDIHTMDGVAAQLGKLGIKFDRGTAGLDSAAMPAAMARQLASLSPTEPFIVPQPGLITINLVKERRPVPTDAAASRPQAVAAWRQQRFGEMMAGQVTQLKGAAKINYQNGFAPPPPPPGARPGATPTP